MVVVVVVVVVVVEEEEGFGEQEEVFIQTEHPSNP